MGSYQINCAANFIESRDFLVNEPRYVYKSCTTRRTRCLQDNLGLRQGLLPVAALRHFDRAAVVLPGGESFAQVGRVEAHVLKNGDSQG